jgi:hypothetical protein
MASQGPDIPHYEVHRRGEDVPIHSMGQAILARLVAIVPGFKQAPGQFKIVEATEGIEIHRLHEVADDTAMLFVLTAVEPEASSRLDTAERHLGQIANIWHNPEEGIRAMFPQSSTEHPLTPSEMNIPDQLIPSWQNP